MARPEGLADERWVPIATAPGGDPARTLQPIYDVLEAAEIPAGFDPYRPGDASSPYPYLHRAFHVVVPESRKQDALAAVHEAGVRIPGEAWSTPSEAEPAPSWDRSDRVLDEDVEIDRLVRRRRILLGAITVVLVLILCYTLFNGLFSWLEIGPFD